jgi:membrane protease subunit HflC
VRRALVSVIALLLVALGLIAAGELGYGPVVITREGDWLHLSTETLPIQTKEGEQLNIDNYVIWRIDDPEAFWRAFQGKLDNAMDRIDGVVRDDVRAVIGRHTLGDVLKDSRAEIMREITASSASTLRQFGVEVADVRINRTELPAGAEGSVYARMRTERERLAKKSRAEGDEKARRIRAQAEREARVIVAEGARDAEIAKGEGDARATAIYAEAYGGDPGFYEFVRTLEAYRKTINEDTTLVVSPRSEFFRFLESSSPPGVSGGRSR